MIYIWIHSCKSQLKSESCRQKALNFSFKLKSTLLHNIGTYGFNFASSITESKPIADPIPNLKAKNKMDKWVFEIWKKV